MKKTRKNHFWNIALFTRFNLNIIDNQYLQISMQTKYLPEWGTYVLIGLSCWLGVSHLLMSGYFCIKEGEAQTGFQDNPLVKAGLNVFVVGTLGLSAAVILSVICK